MKPAIVETIEPARSEEDFIDFFENSLCGFIITNSQGKIMRANGRVKEWTGYEWPEIIDKQFIELLTIGGKIYHETHLAPLLRMQKFFDEVALELVCKDGKRWQVLVNAYEHRDYKGQVQSIRYTLMKGTDRRLYEQTLLNAKATAESNLVAERATAALREQFVAVLGHDLRNPVGAISSGASLMELSNLNDRNKRIVDMIKFSASRMTELIENVMDFARARLGSGIVVDPKPTNMEPVILQVISELQNIHPNRAIKMEIKLKNNINCDAARISQLLSNLLANALTHGSLDYPVRVIANIQSDMFELSVSNGGKAIPPVALKHLFQPFTREDAHASQNGLGLGLYIAAEIAKAHKGELVASSTDEVTRFSFNMPV